MSPDTPIGKWYKDVFIEKHFVPYKNLHETWNDMTLQTPVVTAKLKAAQKAIVPLYRKLYAILKSSPLVDNGDLESMHLPNQAVYEHRKAPVADNAPAFHINVLDSHRIRIFYYPSKIRKSGKPDGQQGAEIKWGFSEELVIDPKELPNSVFDTASPYTLSFNPSDYGRTVYIALRWENTRGQKGPWSHIEIAHVP
jgi:hypothetical protein